MKAPDFISNTPDDKHCVQASVGMVLKYFLPSQKFSMQDLEKFSGFVESKGAWEMEELLNYDKLGLKAKVIVNSSYEEFGKRGFKYLEEIMGHDVTEWAKENTGDIELEMKRSRAVAKKGIHEFRIPQRNDVCNLLADGWLVMVDINARKLNSKPGFAGHRVLIYRTDDESVTMHDPGLPAYPARKISWQALEDAWADPNEDSKMLIAIRKLKE